MAFQLKAHESVRDGVRRNVRHELETVLDQARQDARNMEATAATDAVHEIRKGLKRVRAALRLVRGDLGEEAYHEENFRLRDAARPLALVRDAQMLPATWELLCRESPHAVDQVTAAKVRDALLSNPTAVVQRLLVADKAFAAVEAVVAASLARVASWRLEQDTWAGVEDGLRRTYRMGRRARARAAETRTVEDLHEWRKQAKYLWHALELVEPAWRAREKGLADRAHKLSSSLGADHDLNVLRRTLAADPLPFGGHRVLKEVFALIDRRREELEAEAATLGGPLYDASPDAWTRRILGLGPRPAGAVAV